MGKHVVYLRARDEKELEAAGHDPAEWVRELVRRTLDERATNERDGVAKANDRRNQ